MRARGKCFAGFGMSCRENIAVLAQPWGQRSKHFEFLCSKRAESADLNTTVKSSRQILNLCLKGTGGIIIIGKGC